MAASGLSDTVGFVRRWAGEADDDRLLERYRGARDEAAFAELLRRYGPLVLRVCRRVLANAADAEEAFQNTFLRLVDRARSIRAGRSLPCWLHRVATNEALRLRERTAVRAAHELCAARRRAALAPARTEPVGWLALIDEEVNRLPRHLRAALVLCAVEGLTQAQAAARVGCSRDTITVRLRQARERLSLRLRQRGHEAPALAGLTAALAGEGSAAVPAGLVTAVAAAGALARGGAMPARLRPAVGLLLALALTGVGAYALIGSGPAVPPVRTSAVGWVAVPVQPADPKPDPVVQAIERGIRYLKQQERGRGNWEGSDTVAALNMGGGFTCLALLALLNAGVPTDDPVVARGLDYLRTQVPPRSTYVVGLQTMVFARAGDPNDRPLVQRNVDWLIKARAQVNGRPAGWSYSQPAGARDDGSNTQYAVLGLYEGWRAGATVDPEVWKSIRAMYLQSQQSDGGWAYTGERATPTLTMTAAGLNGLWLSGQALSHERQRLGVRNTPERTGEYEDGRALAKGTKWAGDHFTVRPRGHAFYNLFGLARLGRNSGLRLLGEHDWYREGRDFLLPLQKDDGSWSIENQVTDGWTVVSTSFALLFLTEGRRPVLIRKFAHVRSEDWNLTRYDAANLTDFARRELFQRRPLAWEVYDVRTQDDLGHEWRAEQVRELLRSPVVYLTGRGPLRLREGQEVILHDYVAGGGLLLAEATAGDTEFADSFRKLAARLFPADPLRPVPPDHPIWKAPAAVAPDGLPLEAVTVNGRLAVVFSPRPLAGWWEEGFTPGGPGEKAFRLASNLIAAATGGKLPPPR
jgi:RNA polymerase sigma factor (sigma-70 family)